jgi:hypothetical protein
MKEQIQENERNPKSQEKKEGCVFEMEFEGEKIEIKFKRINFEYPETIQKESGILGYERLFISQEQMCNALAQVLSGEQLNLIKEKTQIDLKNISDLSLFQKTLSSSSELNKYHSENYEKFQQSFKSIELFSKKLLLFLTNNKFPSETFTYVMHIGHKKLQLEKQQFVEDKFILQEIFGFDTYKALNNKQKQYEWTSKWESVFGADMDFADRSKFLLFDKLNNKEIRGPGDLSFYINDSRFKEKFTNDEISIISGNALNVCDNNFFWLYNLLDNNPAFGFSPKDPLFQDYISKSIDRLREINNSNLTSQQKEDPFQKTIFGERLFTELYGIKEAEHNSEHLAKPTDSKHGENVFSPLIHKYNPDDFMKRSYKDDNPISKLFRKYGSTLSKEDDFIFKNEPEKKVDPDDEDFLYWYEQLKSIHDSKSLSYHIPIFIKDKKVKQLKWGHASYATFLTQKGFNVLNIKHSESFPEQ